MLATHDVAPLDRVYTIDALDCKSATFETVHAEASGDMIAEIGRAVLTL